MKNEQEKSERIDYERVSLMLKTPMNQLKLDYDLELLNIRAKIIN